MNKVYRNVSEFIKMTFPDVYGEKRYSTDTSLESYIKRTSKDFKLKIDNIIKNQERPNGT
jgi:hypothetical protein